MKERILTGWTFTRVIYLLIGSFIIVNSIIEKQWLFVAFGCYFAAMGLFAFGCAAGNCFGGNYSGESEQNTKTNIEDVEYEEIKSK